MTFQNHACSMVAGFGIDLLHGLHCCRNHSHYTDICVLCDVGSSDLINEAAWHFKKHVGQTAICFAGRSWRQCADWTARHGAVKTQSCDQFMTIVFCFLCFVCAASLLHGKGMLLQLFPSASSLLCVVSGDDLGLVRCWLTNSQRGTAACTKGNFTHQKECFLTNDVANLFTA